jgi:hypothetical protein
MGSTQAQPQIRAPSLAAMSTALPAQHICHEGKGQHFPVFSVKLQRIEMCEGVEVINTGNT